MYFSWHSIEQKPVFLLNFFASLLWVLGGSPQTLHFIFQSLAARFKVKNAYLRIARQSRISITLSSQAAK